MGVIARGQKHKAKIKKVTNDGTFRPMKKPGTTEYHKPMTSHFNIIKKNSQRGIKQVNYDSDKHAQGTKNVYKKK